MAAGADGAVDWTDIDIVTRSKAAIEGLPSGVLLVTAGGTIVLANTAIEHLFGYARQELLGQPIERLIPDARSWLLQTPPAAYAGEPPAALSGPVARTQAVRHNGSCVDVELRLRPIEIDGRGGTILELHPAPEEPGAVAADDRLDSLRGRPERGIAEVPRGVFESPAARQVMALIEQVAATTSTVLLFGETGSGKEVFASQIHALSARRHRRMVRVNCAAIPSTLIESELFGREKGAFTGALARHAGRFELADKGTIFLDEIGDLPLEVQVKLLRALEEGQIERLGNPRSVHLDTRIIAATHQDLQQRMLEGAFREDLYYRLNVFPIRVPALRERPEDIPYLVWQFVGEFSKVLGRKIDSISSDSMTALQQYPWPGNIRELRNTVERAMIVSAGTRLTIAAPAPTTTAVRLSLKLIDVERQHLHAVLESTRWRVRGEAGAAARLGLKPTTLETRMARLGLRRPERR